MEFVSIRIITEDVQRLAGFYEQVTGLPATVANETSPSSGPRPARWPSAARGPCRCSRPVRPGRRTTTR